jgi:hypothetical protein
METTPAESVLAFAKTVLHSDPRINAPALCPGCHGLTRITRPVGMSSLCSPDRCGRILPLVAASLLLPLFGYRWDNGRWSHQPIPTYQSALIHAFSAPNSRSMTSHSSLEHRSQEEATLLVEGEEADNGGCTESRK